MQDQVAALTTRGVAAACLNSTQGPDTQRAVKKALAAGRVRLLYVAPERLESLAGTLNLVSLLAIDESHCISEWGHEFRPAYRDLGRLRERLGMPPTLALTATATPATRADIVGVLGLTRPVHVVTSFDRPNLHLSARVLDSELDRLAALRHLLNHVDGTVVVYTPTRNRTDGVAAILGRWGYCAAPYHAGLPGEARSDLLTRFLTGGIRVMVATSAFGMGIDKADVRLVVHLGIPARPESYYQEAGRAGRDGKPARCELLWLRPDLEFHARQSVAGVHEHRVALKAGRAVMRRYVLTRGCRRRVLLAYLGNPDARCAGCDNCTPNGSHNER